MKHKQSTLLFLVLALCISCGNKTDREALRNARNYLTEYYTTPELHNEKTLEKGYAELKKNSDFERNGLTVKNYDVVYPLLTELKKYDELEKLLLKDNAIPTKLMNSMGLNIVRYKKEYGIDRNKANMYMRNNLTLMEEQMKKFPEDSTQLMGYFTIIGYLYGKEKTLKKIDSMQASNKKYSNFYYHIIKRGIESYDDSFMDQ